MNVKETATFENNDERTAEMFCRNAGRREVLGKWGCDVCLEWNGGCDVGRLGLQHSFHQEVDKI